MAGIGQRVAIKLIDQTPVISNKNWTDQQTTILRTWADLKVRNANRVTEGGQAMMTQLFEFRFPYRDDITIKANTRLVYFKKRYAIHSVVSDNFYTTVTCESKTID
jgi:hypothetical protein